MNEMTFSIEITDNPSDTCYFSFYPIMIENNKYTAFTDKLKSMDGGFYIYDEDIHCFLRYFLEKYFDPGLKYNGERQEVAAYHEENVFDWYGENYYTYETMKRICSEVLKTASMLKTDYENPQLMDIKKNFWVYRMVAEDDPEYEAEKDSEEATRRHIDVVIDFYNRFAEQAMNMMEKHSNTNLIRIFGV